jgi:hypothetical protein
MMAVVAGLCFSGMAGAEEPGVKAARKILKEQQDTIVWVSAVVKIEMTGGGVQMPGREQKVEALGTVVDASGLTIVSGSALDPMSMIRRITMSRGGQQNIMPRSQTSDVKMRLADGTELPAKLVLKDPDLDIAFVKPVVEEKTTFAHVDISAGGAAAILDDVIALGRLSKSLDRQPTVAVCRVSAVVEKPRTFYVIHGGTAGMGTPVFTCDGKLLGIALMRMAGQAQGLGAMMSGGAMTPVVLPVEDIRELVAQALADKGE